MENKYYVYFLLDPRNFYLPFYIGKGSGDRCYSHYEETRLTCYNLYKFNKIQKLKSLGYKPKILIFADNLTSQEAYDIEEQQILKFGRINFEDYGILVNISPGGNCGPILCGDKTRSMVKNIQKNLEEKFRRLVKVKSFQRNRERNYLMFLEVFQKQKNTNVKLVKLTKVKLNLNPIEKLLV